MTDTWLLTICCGQHLSLAYSAVCHTYQWEEGAGVKIQQEGEIKTHIHIFSSTHTHAHQRQGKITSEGRCELFLAAVVCDRISRWAALILLFRSLENPAVRVCGVILSEILYLSSCELIREEHSKVQEDFL